MGAWALILEGSFFLSLCRASGAVDGHFFATAGMQPQQCRMAAFVGCRFGRATVGAVSRRIGGSTVRTNCCRGRRTFTSTAHGTNDSKVSRTLNSSADSITMGGRPVGRRRSLPSGSLPAVAAGSCAPAGRRRRGGRHSPCRPLPSTAAAAATCALMPSRSPSTACFSTERDDAGATPADSSSGSGGGGDKAEWPAPHPGQAYVARARCGQRYEHGGGTRIRAVVSDLDGTLLGPDKAVSATTLEAVRKARAKGVIFVPASGRSKAGMFSSMGELGEDLKRDGAPFVCMNGLTVYGQGDGDGDHGDIIHSEVMCPRLAVEVVGFWKEHPLAEAAGVSLCGSEGETIVVERLDARTRSFTDWKEPLPKEVGNWEDAIAGGMELNRLYFWGPSRAAVDAFQKDLREHLKDNPAELTRGVPEMIEVLPQGASKAVGLDALLRELGISPHEVIALGDEENDVEMLRSVVGVAMGQSSLEVRRSAQFTAPSNANHGVAVALETFCDI